MTRCLIVQERLNDVTVRRVTDELERIARNERQHGPIAGVEHVNIFRFHHECFRDGVAVNAIVRGELERITRRRRGSFMRGWSQVTTFSRLA